ncbi:hypothetical protein ACWCQW_53875 [Streptomyces mirabilis]
MSARIKWQDIIDRARDIVEGYDGGVTVRQVMYRLVAEALVPNTAPTYRRLSSRLAQARRDGLFPDLVDTIREVHVPPAWPDAAAFVADMPDWFRLDRTRGQEWALYVAAEKETLRQLLTGWLAEYGVPVLVVRGFGSQSYADVVRERARSDPRSAALLSGHGRRTPGAVAAGRRTARRARHRYVVRAPGLLQRGGIHRRAAGSGSTGEVALVDLRRLYEGE